MGLAAPKKKKVKLSHDPNNTRWARSTEGFGHKILIAQGWTPGSLLGARNAKHAEHYTAASASHIRVAIKDDNLGLGARPRGMGDDEPTGLSAFQGLLGRLNGKSDAELAEEQRKRDDAKLAMYAQRKYNAIQFISGGFLVPEDVTPRSQSDESKKETDVKDSEATSQDSDKADAKTERISKVKDKDEGDKKDKEKKKKKKDKEKKGKKEKGKKKKKKKEKEESDESDKKSKKRKASSSPLSDDEAFETQNPSSSDEAVKTTASQAAKSRSQTPIGRQAIRGRHIQQKKRAVMDERSLQEIFMVKA